MKALIILNGEIKDLDRVTELGKEPDFILCADGGTDYCFKASLTPDMVIGDLDSISEEAIKKVIEKKVVIKKFPVKKNATDAELSIEYLIKKGFKNITIIGATGNRMDHTLGNILLLKKLVDSDIEGKIVDSNNTIHLINKELHILKEKGAYVSLIPITDAGVVVTLKGFEYELNKSLIKFGTTLGISNRIIENQGQVLVHEGYCLVIISKE